MKKKLILAALIAAAVTATAQMTQNDSIALLYRSLAQTNAELARVTQQTRTTAMLVGVGGVSMIAGTAFALAATSHDAIETGSSETLAKVGTGFAIAGVGCLAASLFTMPKNVTIDHRGFVFGLPFKQGKKRR